MAPVVQSTCWHATRLVCGPTASRTSASGTARTVAPRPRAAISGPYSAGCSVSDVTISSPAPRPRPATIRPTPSDVDEVERDVLGLGAEALRVRRADLHAGLEQPLPARPGAALVGRSARGGTRGLHRLLGDGAAGPGVQIRLRAQDRELRAQGCGIHVPQPRG